MSPPGPLTGKSFRFVCACERASGERASERSCVSAMLSRVLGLGEAKCGGSVCRICAGVVPGLSRGAGARRGSVCRAAVSDLCPGLSRGCPVVVPLVSKLEKWSSLVLRENKDNSFFEFWHKPLLCRSVSVLCSALSRVVPVVPVVLWLSR